MENQGLPATTGRFRGSVRLWTDKELGSERQKNLWLNLGLSGLGLLLLIGAAVVGDAPQVGCLQSILGLTGFFLLVGRWIIVLFFPAIQFHNSKSARRLAGKQESWFHSVNCPDCDSKVRVNIGYLDFTCQHCGSSDNWVRAGIKENPVSIQNGAICSQCGGKNDLSTFPANFSCPNCTHTVQRTGWAENT